MRKSFAASESGLTRDHCWENFGSAVVTACCACLGRCCYRRAGLEDVVLVAGLESEDDAQNGAKKGEKERLRMEVNNWNFRFSLAPFSTECLLVLKEVTIAWLRFVLSRSSLSTVGGTQEWRKCTNKRVMYLLEVRNSPRVDRFAERAPNTRELGLMEKAVGCFCRSRLLFRFVLVLIFDNFARAIA